MDQIKKPVTPPAIQPSASIITLFGEVKQADASLSAKLALLATDIAKQVEALEMLFASKLQLIEITYAAEFTALAKANRNTIATLRALIVARVAGDEPIEIKAPSKDGKTAAVKKPANQLNAGEAKRFAAEIKATQAELDESPDAKAAREATEKAAKKAADEAASKAALDALAKKREEAFAYVLATANLPELFKRLESAGYKVKKGTPPTPAE